MIKKNSKEVGFVLKGTQNIDKKYLGTDLVFEQGFTREQTGVPPITTNYQTIGKNLKDYKIYGNSVQNGTPTPDNPIEIQSVGDKTKNLFNLANLIEHKNIGEDGALVNNNNYNVTQLIYLPTGTYTTSCVRSLEVNGETFTVHEYLQDGTSVRRIFQVKNQYVVNKTFTVDHDCYIRVGYRISQTNLMLEKGSTSTYYEPYGYKIPVIVSDGINSTTTNIYLDEPLSKLGDYADYVDFANQKVVRNIKEVRFNGTENWMSNDSYADTNNYGYIYERGISNPIYQKYNEAQTTYLSNSFEGVMIDGSHKMNNQMNIYTSVSGSNNWVYVGVTFATTVNEWKTWLQNNDFYLDYVLATPEEEEIELPNIPTLKGTTTLMIDTTIQPSNMYIKYKGK